MISATKCHDEHSHSEFFSLIVSSKRLPPTLSSHQVTELNLSNLQLVQIASFPFDCFPKLQSLDLSHNQLRSIDIDWAKLTETSIEHLNLSYNQLDTLLFLKDLQYLRTLNVSENVLRQHERFLALYLCPTIEHLLDSHTDQMPNDRFMLDRLVRVAETDIDQLWLSYYYNRYRQALETHQSPDQLLGEFRRSMMNIIESQPGFAQFHLSAIGNAFLDHKLQQICSTSQRIPCKATVTSDLSADFSRLMNIQEASFQPKTFLRSHHQSNDTLTSTPVWMCAFEPNTSEPILATCGGRKVCFVDCGSGEITHLFEVPMLDAPIVPAGRKKRDQLKLLPMEYFSCLCWIEIAQGTESLKLLAVGATNGHIYLLSHTWKLMFGHIELPGSSISCLTWHTSDPLTLVIASHHTVRCVSIRSYIDRLRSFIRKRNKPTTPFDYVDSTLFMSTVSTTCMYNLDAGGENPSISITDLLFYPMLTTKTLLLLVGTTAGLFVIRYREKQEQSLIQLALPKSIWTVSEHIESLGLIDSSTHLVAMNVLGLDHVCCFNLEQALHDQQIHPILSLPNPARQIPTKMAIAPSTEHTKASFECIVGSHHGSVLHYQIRTRKTSQKASLPQFEYTSSELTMPVNENSVPPNILSASVNEHYFVFTTSNNLVCIYQR